MNIEQLRILKVLGEEKSFSNTARRLNLTTSAVSQAIGKLEDELNIKLIKRDRKFSYPTEQGLFIIKEANKLLDIENEIYKYANDKSKKALGLSIGAIPGINYPLIKTFKELRLKYDYLEFSFFEDDTEQLLKGLIDREFNYAVLSFSENLLNYNLDYKITKLLDGDFVFIVSDKSPLAEKEILTYEDVIKENLVIYKDKFLLNYVNDIAFYCNKKEKILLKCNSLSAVINIVQENMAISPVPNYTVANNFNKTIEGIKILKIEKNSIAFNPNLWFLELKGNEEKYIGEEFLRLIEKNIR